MPPFCPFSPERKIFNPAFNESRERVFHLSRIDLCKTPCSIYANMTLSFTVFITVSFTCSVNYEGSATGDIFPGISFSAEAHTYLQTGQAVNSPCYSSCEVVRLERQGVRMVTHKMLLVEGVCRDRHYITSAVRFGSSSGKLKA